MRALRLSLLLSLLALLFVASSPVSLHAGVFTNYTVDRTDDTTVTVCLDGTPNDCTLRGALDRADAPGTFGDGIDFDATVFPSGAPATITISSALVMDNSGGGEGGDTIFATNRGVIIDGAGEPSAFSCLIIANDNNTVTGLQITDCSAGVSLTIEASVNTIGPGNTIYDNSTGVLLNGGGNFIEGNKIGTTADGSAIHPDGGNTSAGVSVSGDSNIIGGSVVGDRNIISGNATGVSLSTNAQLNHVRGNYIGTDAAGEADLGNTLTGVSVGFDSNTVGGAAAGQGNLISGNGVYGILIGSNGTNVQGNTIGTNAGGTVAIPNGETGIYITNAPENTIGGTTPGARNVISGNGVRGIWVAGSLSLDNIIQGNYIGLDKTGTTMIPNPVGVFLSDGRTMVGGVAAGAGNVISGNSVHGIDISPPSAGNTVYGNLIGTRPDGISASSNLGSGVRMYSGASNNTIGGDGAGQANVIAFNTRGVYVDTTFGTAIDNSIRGNSIHSNGLLGIDLHPVGVTDNDAGDGDAGANNLQNFPLLSGASATANGTNVSGTLNSAASTQFFLDFYSSPSCDGTNGEGKVYLDSAKPTTDGSGNLAFQLLFPTPTLSGHVITATATDPAGNTSEFSPCAVVPVDSDSDNDRVADSAETPCGADPLDPSKVPERLDSPLGIDDDGDTLINEPLPAGSGTHDCDGDGFVGNAELIIFDISGTANDQDPCGATGWPLELVDTVPSANEADIVDLGNYIAPTRRLNTSPPNVAYGLRWDVIPGNSGFGEFINIVDLGAFISGPPGYPPMLAGARAFNSMCPSPP